MNTQMDGKPISVVEYIAADGHPYPIMVGTTYWCGVPLGCVISKIFLSATYHGDHDEFWCVLVSGEEEVARINCKHVISIVWDRPTPPQADR